MMQDEITSISVYDGTESQRQNETPLLCEHIRCGYYISVVLFIAMNARICRSFGLAIGQVIILCMQMMMNAEQIAE